MKDKKTKVQNTSTKKSASEKRLRQSLEKACALLEGDLPEVQAHMDDFAISHTLAHNDAMQFKQDALAGLYAKYPYFFHEEIDVFPSIPVGWLKGIEQAFDKFAATGMNVMVYNIYFDNNTLCAETAGEHIAHVLDDMSIKPHFLTSAKLLNDLLAPVTASCVLCGNARKKDDENAKTSQHSTVFGLCPHCEKVFSASTTMPEKKADTCAIA